MPFELFVIPGILFALFGFLIGLKSCKTKNDDKL